jgi:hypothetical protein
MDIKKMQDLYEGLKHRPDIQVGVFQAKTDRKGVGLTNATLAAIHEFGAPEHGLPARSVLKTPIKDHIKDIMGSVKGKADMILKATDVKKFWDLVGVAAYKVVDGAFRTGGYGKWAPDSYKTLLAKLNKGKFRKLSARKSAIAQIYAGQVGMGILIDTSQLRRSYRSRVIMKI